MKILKHPIFEPCTCDKCMTVFQADANDELETVCYEGVIQAWKIECPVCRHRCNLEWAGIINPSDVTDTNVDHKSEWISVYERLPDQYEDVLGFCHYVYESGGVCDLILTMKLTTDGKFVPFNCYPMKEEIVTHWMPLPEPPDTKGGE